MTELDVLLELRTQLQDGLLVALGILAVGVIRLGVLCFVAGNQR
jgi:hypothetical protein